MGKLYLASYQFKKPHNGELVDEKRLIHADIKEGSEQEKCSILTEWLREWFMVTYPKEVELTGAKVNPTIDWVAKEEVKERPLDRPANHTLQEIFAELKFGRPAKGQIFLQKCIDELNKEESIWSGIKYQKLNKALSDTDHSVYFVRNDDPDNAVLAGYGGTYGEALLDFAKRLDKSKYRLNDNLEFEYIIDDVQDI